MHSAVTVLNRIAQVLSCEYDEIERDLSRRIGKPIGVGADAEQRVATIRRVIGTPEAASIISHVGEIVAEQRGIVIPPSIP